MQSWIPYALKSLKIFLLVAVVAIGLMALDASAEEQVFDTILAKYQSAAAHWQGIMLSAAKSIFWPLALISLSWRLIQRAIDGVDIPGLFREIFWPGFFIGFYYFLLVNGSSIASAILSTFMHLADQGSAVSGMSRLAYSPSGIRSMSNEIWWEVLKTSGKGIVFSLIPGTDSGFFANLLGVFVSFGIWVLLAMVAIDVLILLIASWVLLYGGLVILAFGGGFGFGFHQYAINYFRSVIALGLQLLGTGLIVTVGLSVMQTDLIAFKDGFNLQTLMSFLLCAMAMKMVVGSIPPMLAGMINGNVGALGPKGEGVIGGLVGAGVTAATTAVSLGLGAAAGAKMKAAQAGLDKVKAAVNARNAMPGAGGGASGAPNSISAAMPGGSEETPSGGSAYAKAMGLNPGGSTYGANVPSSTSTQSSVTQGRSSSTETSIGNASGSSPSVPIGSSNSSSMSANAGATQGVNSQALNGQSTPTEGASGSASVAPSSGMDFAMPSTMGAEGGNSVDTASMPSQGSGNFAENTLSPQSVSANSSPNNGDFSTYSLPQLEAKQKEFEEQVRKYSAKRDYHYASARSALVSGSKTLFNYMAFFNNRGYF